MRPGTARSSRRPATARATWSSRRSSTSRRARSPGKFNNTGNFKIGTALIARSVDTDINPNLDGTPVIGEDAARRHERRRRVHRPDRRPGVDEHAGRVPRAPEQRNRRPEDPSPGSSRSNHELEATEGNDTMSLSTINIAPIEHFLRAMTAAGATDLMLTAHTQPRMRVDGRLNPIARPARPDAGRARGGHRRAADARAAHASCTRRRKSTSRSRTTTRTASVATASSSRASWRCRCGRSRSRSRRSTRCSCRGAASTSATCRRASCSSPARPAPASRRRSRR